MEVRSATPKPWGIMVCHLSKLCCSYVVWTREWQLFYVLLYETNVLYVDYTTISKIKTLIGHLIINLIFRFWLQSWRVWNILKVWTLSPLRSFSSVSFLFFSKLPVLFSYKSNGLSSNMNWPNICASRFYNSGMAIWPGMVFLDWSVDSCYPGHTV